MADRTDWKALAERYGNAVKKQRESYELQTRYALDTIEVGGSSFAVGYVHGRNGAMPKRLGVPLDLGAAAVLKLVAFMGWGAKYTPDVHSLGNGPLAYFLGSMGAERGQVALRAAKDKDGKPVALNRPLTEAEAKDRNVDVRTIVAGDGTPEKKQIAGPRTVPVQRAYVSQAAYY